MSLPMQKLALIGATFAALFLSACGFQPLYGGSGFAQLPGLEINRGDNRIDYLIEDSLRDYLGAGRSSYRLELNNTSVQRGLGLSSTGIARQYALQITSRYALYDSVGNLITNGTVEEEALFDAGSDPYTLISGASAAEAQASEAIAERLVRDIAIALRQREVGLTP